MLRKQWRRDHPFGFSARPVRTSQGVLDLKKWEVGVPGKEKTIWEGGLFKLEVTFPDGRLDFLLTSMRTAQLTEIRRVPDEASQMQIHPAALPSKRIPLRHRLPIYSERRRRLEASNHPQGDSAGYPVATRRAKSGVTRSG